MEDEEHQLLADRIEVSRSSFRNSNITLCVATGIAMILVIMSYLLILRDELARRNPFVLQSRLENYNRMLDRIHG